MNCFRDLDVLLSFMNKGNSCKDLFQNDFNWETSLHEAEKTAVKLDSEWIKHLRNAWSHPVSEQIPLQTKHTTSDERPRRSTIPTKQTNRRFIRPSVPHTKKSSKNDMTSEEHPDDQSTTIDNYSHQKFLDWRSFLSTNSPHFQLYILPVKA